MSYPKFEKDIIVFYHAYCPDGFSGAWAAWKKFGEAAQYVPLMHNLPAPDDLESKELYFIDIVYEMDDLLKLKEKNRKVVVLDHHASREAETKAAHEFLYGAPGDGRSGAGLAWEYFFKDAPLPLFLEYIQAQDLSSGVKEENVKAILVYAETVPMEFSAWDLLVSVVQEEKSRMQIVEQGKLLVSYRNLIIKDMVGNANKVQLGGITAFAVNSAFTAVDTDVATAMMEHYEADLAIVWYETRGRVKVSLRGRNAVDVSKIAEQFGGGGHKYASGFSLEIGQEKPWQYL